MEVIVVLAILGLMAGLSGLALASLQPPRGSVCVRELRSARSEAIRTGRPVRTVLSADTVTNCSVLRASLFLPDGRAIGTEVDPLTGAPRADR